MAPALWTMLASLSADGFETRKQGWQNSRRTRERPEVCARRGSVMKIPTWQPYVPYGLSAALAVALAGCATFGPRAEGPVFFASGNKLDL